MTCYCLPRCSVDELAGSDSTQELSAAYKRRFGIDSPALIMVFEIRHKPIIQKDTTHLRSMGEKVLSGIFMGYRQQADAFGNSRMLSC